MAIGTEKAITRLRDIKAREVSVVRRGANKRMFLVVKDAESDSETVEKATWTQKFINNLPDAAFAIIDSGGKKDDGGLTTPRNMRHLPHHTADVKDGAENDSVDLPHLRNALARLEQMKGMGDTMKAKARKHLEAHASVLLEKDDGTVPAEDVAAQTDTPVAQVPVVAPVLAAIPEVVTEKAADVPAASAEEIAQKAAVDSQMTTAAATVEAVQALAAALASSISSTVIVDRVSVERGYRNDDPPTDAYVTISARVAALEKQSKDLEATAVQKDAKIAELEKAAKSIGLPSSVGVSGEEISKGRGHGVSWPRDLSAVN